jgi:hypothetical protein
VVEDGERSEDRVLTLRQIVDRDGNHEDDPNGTDQIMRSTLLLRPAMSAAALEHHRHAAF